MSNSSMPERDVAEIGTQPLSITSERVMNSIARLNVLLQKRSAHLERITDTTLMLSAPRHLIPKIVDAVRLADFGVSAERIDEFIEKEEYYDVVAVSGSKHEIQRSIGRIIGRRGKIKKTIEELTGADIYIRDNSVLILGTFESIEKARNAVLGIAQGKPQGPVLRSLGEG
jgi:hypothetical protein